MKTTPDHVSAVLCAAAPAAAVDASVRALRAAGVGDVEIVISGPSRGEGPPAGAEVVPSVDPRAINHAVAATTGEIVLLVGPFVRLYPTAVELYLAALDRDPEIVVAYGDYEVVCPGRRAEHRPAYAERDDLSEWSTFAYVQAIRRTAWERVGGFDERYETAFSYDLRLRLGEVGDFARVAAPAYAIHLEPNQIPPAFRGYFTSESCERPGFAYLFFESGLEQEVDRAFRGALERRGAILRGPPSVVSCPDRDDDPKVSVVIPTFDRVKYLGRAIESVLSGEFQSFEVLVVDNGSTDGSIELVQEYCARDARVRFLSNPKGNEIAAALNFGVAEARGKYVSQLDSDDEYVPETLKKQVAHLEANPTWAVAISYYDVIDAAGVQRPEFGIVRHEEYDRDNLLRTGGAGAARTWHRCVLRELGGFNEVEFANYAEDYDMTLRVGERYEVGRVHHVLYRHRIHGENTVDNLDYVFRAGRKAAARRLALARRTR